MVAIFIMFILLIHEHGRSFHLLIPSSISFFKDLNLVCLFVLLILYPATLPKVLISCRSCLVEFLRSLMYTIISPANSNTLTSFVTICVFLISFCLTALTRTTSTILDRYRESGQPWLVPDFSGIALSFSPFNLMLTIGLL